MLACMDVMVAGSLATRPITHFDSRGFCVQTVGRSAHVIMVRLDPQGRLGRHRAVIDQALLVVEGDAQVSGAQSEPVEVRPGHIVVWRGGEEHETATRTGLTAVIIEEQGLASELLG
jgi:quercetin dioxygenase-like cupin family protein